MSYSYIANFFTCLGFQFLRDHTPYSEYPPDLFQALKMLRHNCRMLYIKDCHLKYRQGSMHLCSAWNSETCSITVNYL